MEKFERELAGLAESYENMAEATELDDNDVYSCQLCHDCGWIIDDGKARPCSCQAAPRDEKKLLPIPHLQKMRFSDFDLKLYPVELKTDKGKSYRKAAEEALDEAWKFASALSRGINRPGLIFEGDVGSGKTYLAAAIANDLLTKGVDLEFIVVPEFLDELRQNIRSEGNEVNYWIERAKNAAVLFFDDLGAHTYSAWVQDILFTIINYRLNHQLPLIVTTNLNVEELYDAIGVRIASRLMEIGTNVKIFTDMDIRLKLYLGGRSKW
jgi:DNA replication protein DnaC